MKKNDCIFIVLGATGDLTKRKLIPALYNLVETKKISRFAFLGVSITQTTIANVIEQAKPFVPHGTKKIWNIIEKNAYYYAMDFHDSLAYEDLCRFIKTIEKKHNLPNNRLFYLATMPQHFEVITQNIARCKIVCKANNSTTSLCGWSRVIYEKPFGYNLTSAKKINRAIARVFDESQIFRIDHYLGKELVANIALVRFTNRILEPLWNRHHIDSIQIVMNETVGVEGRGAFYDNCGALKDVVQNHMLQILSLVAMEAPRQKFTAEYLRNAKANVLSKVKVKSVVLGQYEEYKKEKFVAPNSTTETFAALKVAIDNNRWKGIPFYLKTGKYLNNKETSIHIKFKMVKCLLDFCPMDSNYLTINIDPDEGFFLELNVKAPGVFNEVVPAKMDFSHKASFGPNTPKAYETLIADAIRGDQFAFVRSDEIIQSWKIIDSILKEKYPIHEYPKKSTGPEALKKLDNERSISWRA